MYYLEGIYTAGVSSTGARVYTGVYLEGIYTAGVASTGAGVVTTIFLDFLKIILRPDSLL